MKSILILQNEIMLYRKPVFNGLAQWYKVVVLHSGSPSVRSDDLFSEIITSDFQIGRFHLQKQFLLKKIIHDYDVVIAMFDLAYPVFLMPLFWRKRPMIILWGHRYSSNWLACKFRDWLMRKADRLLMYGVEEYDRIISRGIDPSKLFIAWNTVHVPNYHNYSNAKKNSLLFVGRLQPSKRIDTIIKEFARIQDSLSSDTILNIVGSPAYNYTGIDNELKRLAKTLGIDQKVIFHDRLDDPYRLAEIFSRAYAYISPGPVGLGVLHSFAYGVPVITLNNERHGPEFYNLEHNYNALICNNLTELSDAMRTVCIDTVLSSKLGNAAYKHYVTKRPLSAMLNGFVKAIEV